MKPYLVSLLNAIILVGLGSWAYGTSDGKSWTALIPVIIGVILIVINPGVKKEAKIPAHIAVVVTLLAVIGLCMALSGSIKRGSEIGIIRVSIMLVSSIVAVVFFIKSFIDVRKQRKIEHSGK